MRCPSSGSISRRSPFNQKAEFSFISFLVMKVATGLSCTSECSTYTGNVMSRLFYKLQSLYKHLLLLTTGLLCRQTCSPLAPSPLGTPLTLLWLSRFFDHLIMSYFPFKIRKMAKMIKFPRNSMHRNLVSCIVVYEVLMMKAIF